MKLENIQDLSITKDEDNFDSSQNLQVVKKEDVIIGDLEEMELTSKNYKIKTKKTKKFWNKTLIRIVFVIIVFYLSILFLYPFITTIQKINVRIMFQQNGNLGLNQNYERVDPNDKLYT